MVKKSAIITVVILMFIACLPGEAKAEYVSVSAESAILMEAESGRILYGKDENKKMRIASITKIMTAILAIESGKMDDLVKVSKRAVGVEGSSIYLREGEKMLLEDLVYGLMLKSGNDAAVAIAEHVAGSVEGFVFLTNEKAVQLGMSNTSFQNPHGLDDHEEHYSTAIDMALLTQYAMKSEQFREISATKSHRVDGETIRVWKNKNRLLTELYPYSTGGKTGFTKRAKRTLVSTASKDNMNLISVTLNAPSDWHDHMNLFNWAFTSHTLTRLIDEGVQKEITDEFYKNHIYAPFSFEYPLTELEASQVKKEMTLYKPPTKNQREHYIPPKPVGKIEIFIEEELIGQVPLYYDPPQVTENKGFWKRMVDLFSFVIGVRSVD